MQYQYMDAINPTTGLIAYTNEENAAHSIRFYDWKNRKAVAIDTEAQLVQGNTFSIEFRGGQVGGIVVS